MVSLTTILETLFRHATENAEDQPSPGLLDCLNEISQLLRGHRIHVEMQEYEVITKNGNVHKRANLFAYRPDFTGQHILFQGHLDTVPFERPYRYEITPEFICGRGAVDMKGPLAGMLLTFIELYQIPGLTYSPALLITGDEEANNFAGIRNFLTSRYPDIYLAINGEPTELAVATKLRGVAMYELEQQGIPRHSSSLENDRLIEKAIPLLQAIEIFLNKSRKISSSQFGDTIGALTIVQAGEKANQLPARLRISFNLRTVSDKANYELLFNEIVNKHLTDKTSVKTVYVDPVVVELDTHRANLLREGFKKSGMSYREITKNAFTEATLLNQQGIPTVICGPGSMKLAHVRAQDEIIKISEIVTYCSVLRNIVTGAYQVDN